MTFARENVQRLLRNAGVVACVMRVFEIPYDHAKAGAEGEREHTNLRELFKRCAGFLRIWVADSPESCPGGGPSVTLRPL